MDAVVLLRRTLSAFHRGQEGFAGLATAALAFTAASAILASASLADGTSVFDSLSNLTRQGVARSAGSLELRGSPVLTASGTPLKVDSIQLTLGSFGVGAPVSLLPSAPSDQRLVINYQDANVYLPDVPYTARELSGNADGILQPGELVLIKIRWDDIAPSVGSHLGPNQRFTLELLSPLGGTVSVRRTLPFGLDPVMLLP